MQTVLITGTHGFVATYLVSLLAPHYAVIATARTKGKETLSQNIIYEQLDFKDADAVDTIFSTYKPDVVVHSGAMSKPDDCETDKQTAFKTNVIGTRNLLAAAASHNSFFVFLSTDFVFDGLKGMYAEEDPTGKPVNYYGQTKLEAEEAVQQYPHLWSIIRTVLVYGKPLAGRQNILTVVAEKLRNGEVYNVFGDQVRTPTYVEDLTGAIKKIIDLKKGGLYHISGEDILTPYQMAVKVAELLQLDKDLLKEVNRETFKQPALRPLKTGFNISKAKQELGFQPISFTEGLNKTFA